MNKPILIFNGIEVTSLVQLEELISDLSEESKIALRLLFAQQEGT